ncbi:hypothetical protein DH2020_027662 [Rehmannia glutinosa]|uniref:Uncharacterized protein n=1 Tax=Rehmannia glutinosa TaxID=99300 RepID=A0ABR0VXN1_REHGL
MGLELHDNNGGSIEKVSLNQIEVSDALVTPTNGPFKGILKRNRRGCRGLCNCLNCASFRLHADRAFEFSRNQMHDAEEVASDLMKELANLRSLLEKSVITDNDLAAIQLNPVLIKQACNKAVETENLAKERLSQLNYDLNVHCRIPPSPAVSIKFLTLPCSIRESGIARTTACLCIKVTVVSREWRLRPISFH